MERLGLLAVKDGIIKKTMENYAPAEEATADAIIRFSSQILAKAIEANRFHSASERQISSVTFAIDPSLLPEAKKMTRRFIKKLMQHFESGERKEVYCFSVNLFRLSHTARNPLPPRFKQKP